MKYIKYSGKEFKEHIIKGEKPRGILSFYSEELEYESKINKVENGTISLDSIKVKEKIILSKYKEYNIHIKNCYFKLLSCQSGNRERIFSVQSGKINYLFLKGFGLIEINDIESNTISINNTTKGIFIGMASKPIFKHLTISNFGKQENKNTKIYINFNSKMGDVKIHGISATTLVMEGTNTGKIMIENSTIDSLIIDRLSNLGEIIINNLGNTEEESLIEINKTNLGKTYIYQTNINQFGSININESNIRNMKILGPKIDTKKINYKNKENQYNILNQLHQIAQEEGDREDIIKYDIARNNTLLQLSSINQKDKISLLISKKRSNFGTNRRKATKTTIGISAITYIAWILTSYNIYREWTNPIQWNFVWQLGGNFFIRLNPIHSLDDFGISFIGKFLDLFNRVVMGFGIYETIRSFRKYHRK